MNNCQQCGGPVFEDEKFCPGCGRPVNAPMPYGYQMPIYGGFCIQQQVGYGYPQLPYGYPQLPAPATEQRMRPEPERMRPEPERMRPDPEAEEAVEEAVEEVIEEEEVAAEEVEVLEEIEVVPAKSVNGFSVAGIILAFCGLVSIGISSVFGILLSLIGIAKAKDYNGAGKALGVVAIIVALIVIAAAVALYVIYMNNVNALFEMIIEEIKTFAA